jgi:hypothetical protein
MTSKEEIEEESYEALSGTSKEAEKGMRSGATDKKDEKA